MIKKLWIQIPYGMDHTKMNQKVWTMILIVNSRISVHEKRYTPRYKKPYINTV